VTDFKFDKEKIMQTLIQDLRHGARMLLKQPGFTLIAVVTLSLGIGANTAIFSVVNAALLRPLPFSEAERLIVLRQQTAQAGDLRFSVPELSDYRQQNQTLVSIEEYHTDAFVLFGLAEPVRVQTGVVSAGFFDLLGLRTALGRNFSPDADTPGSEPTLLLSHDFWLRRFGGDNGVIGRSFQLSGASHAQGKVFTVIGVLPPALPFPACDDLYMPAGASPFRSSANLRADRQTRRLQLVARLKSGATIEQAQADLAAIGNRLQQAFPEAYPPSAGFRVALTPLQEELTRQARPALLLLLASVGLVLLLACANVANLMLARLLKREKELAIRAALGASRIRLFRQLLTESLLLALISGVLGLLVAWWGMDLLTAYVARLTPRATETRLDGAVLFFALLLSFLTGILAGVFPACRSRQQLTAALNESHKTSLGVEKRFLRGALVVAQVAISIVLLVGTGLLARSLINLYRVDSGFDAANVLTARVTLNPSKFEDEAQQVALFNAVLEKINAHPEVISSAVAASAPLQQARSVSRGFLIENRRAEEGRPQPAADLYVASSGYFKTLGVPVLKGRTFGEQDQADAPGVAVINQSMARYYWNDEDPLGRRISLDQGESWLTVVGVVGNVRQLGLDKEAAHQVFRPYAQFAVGNLILVRTRANPRNFARQIQTAIAAVDPQLPVDQVRTLEQIRSDSIASPRLTAALLGMFAALALVICVAGIASVTALTVGERTREIGIRLALGARGRDILKLIIGREMAQVLIGAVLGLACALALTRVMSNLLSGLLFGVGATDPLTFGLIGLLLAFVALLACWIPARRATKVDPMIALRTE
jgi:predicted permease